MLPEPLHPIVVHFPMVFVVLLPISAAIALWAIRRGAAPLKGWAIPAAFAVALAGSAWVALETGEAEEEKVEAFVSEAAINEHEEAAERFLVFSGVLALVAGVGLLSGVAGRAARLVASVGTLAVLAAGIQVGAAGGRLVYEHGAAQAYVSGSASGMPMMQGGEGEEEGGEDEGDR
ncbi:MAG: hypothetical protein FJ207_07025 [Gemmatimonadetes bacterium]|nr:hypothetical protein [Gemmatimonadota bacterium]